MKQVKCKFCGQGGKLKAGSKAESLLTDKLKELRKELLTK